MQMPIAREDLEDEIADALSDANDLDVGWHTFAKAVIAVLERHGVTFAEEEP